MSAPSGGGAKGGSGVGTTFSVIGGCMVALALFCGLGSMTIGYWVAKANDMEYAELRDSKPRNRVITTDGVEEKDLRPIEQSGPAPGYRADTTNGGS